MSSLNYWKVSYSTSLHSTRALSSCTAPTPFVIWPLPHLGLDHFLLLWLPKKLNDNQMEDVGGAGWRGCRRGAWAQWHWWVLGGGAGDKMSNATCWPMCQPRKSREVESTNGPACKHKYLGQCGGIRCQTVLHDQQGVIWILLDILKGYIITFCRRKLCSQPLIC